MIDRIKEIDAAILKLANERATLDTHVATQGCSEEILHLKAAIFQIREVAYAKAVLQVWTHQFGWQVFEVAPDKIDSLVQELVIAQRN